MPTTSPAKPADASKLTPQEKAASDSLMKQGLGQLQTAQSDLQGNNAAGAAEALKSAFESMRQAKPIYHGHRKDALMDTRRAERNIEANKKNSAERAAGFLNSAISEAQTALSTN